MMVASQKLSLQYSGVCHNARHEQYCLRRLGKYIVQWMTDPELPKWYSSDEEFKQLLQLFGEMHLDGNNDTGSEDGSNDEGGD